MDKTYIFLFEFKLGGTAQAAMREMREMRYAERYSADPSTGSGQSGRRVTLIGVAFSRKTRNLGRRLIQPAG